MQYEMNKEVQRAESPIEYVSDKDEDRLEFDFFLK